MKKKKLLKNFKRKNTASSQSFDACSSKTNQLMLSHFLDAMPRNKSDVSGGDDCD